MRVLLFSILLPLLAACRSKEDVSSPHSSGRPVGELKGLAQINVVMRTRVLDPFDARTAEFHIEKLGGRNVARLAALFGDYQSEGASNEFRGGEANPFGMMLWSHTLGIFAAQLGASCKAPADSAAIVVEDDFDGSVRFRLNPQLQSILVRLCAQPSSREATTNVAQELWMQIMAFDAPFAELTAFRDFAGERHAMGGAAGELVTDSVYGILMSPYFLFSN